MSPPREATAFLASCGVTPLFLRATSAGMARRGTAGGRAPPDGPKPDGPGAGGVGGVGGAGGA
eukprot:3909053-Prymnesium_polylepis.1